MIKKMKLLTAILLIFSVAAQAQDVTFSGTADKKYDGDKIIIYNRSGLHDSAVIRDGKFVFNVPFKEPGLYVFYSKAEAAKNGGYSPYSVMVTKPGTIKMDVDGENFANTKVTGSSENDLYKAYASESNKAQQQIMDHLTVKYGKELVMNRTPDTSSTQYKALMKEYFELSDAHEKKQLEGLKQFISQNPNSFSAIYLLNSYATSLELDDVENLYASLAPDYKQTSAGKSITSTIEARKITAIGQIAPDFTQEDTLGKPVKLSDFRGKYVLIDFWASWCGPCRAENPNLVKTFHKYKDRGFTILGVSLDQPGKKEAWLGAIHKDNLAWTQVSDLKFWNNEAAVLYGIKAIPASLLLDPQGRIIAKDLRGEELNKKLEEVL